MVAAAPAKHVETPKEIAVKLRLSPPLSGSAGGSAVRAPSSTAGGTVVRKHPTAAINWVIVLSVPLGLAAFLPTASWIYAELCDYKFMVWVWLSRLQHGIEPDKLVRRLGRC